MDHSIILSELVSVRLCHDLSGSVGAVSNGIELFKETQDDNLKQQSMELVEMSSKDAMAKIILFRHADGQSSSGDVAGSKMIEISNNFLERNNIACKWHIEDNMNIMNPHYSRLLSNIILFASNAVVGGGVMDVEIENNADLKLNTKAKMIRVGEGLAECAKGLVSIEMLNIKNIQSYMISVLAKNINKKISIDVREDELEILLT